MHIARQEIIQAIERNRASLAEAVVARQFELQHDLASRYGEHGWSKCVQDVDYHLLYLAEGGRASSPVLFADYVAWAKVLLNELNIPANDLRISLECLRDTLKVELSSDAQAIVAETVEAGLMQLAQPSESGSFLLQGAPLHTLARDYLQALLHGDRRAASQMVLAAVQQGTPVKDIYLHVFQPSQHEIGRLWQTNQISVAQEHYCTAATQLVMSQLYPYVFAGEKIGRRLIACCVGGELHEIGIRMVADFFEMEGWDTYYLGANTPTDSILRSIAERQVDILAISATMTFHIGKVTELIERVQSSQVGKAIKILVGGYPFNISRGLWQQAGADGYAVDAAGAIFEANRLITAQRGP